MQKYETKTDKPPIRCSKYYSRRDQVHNVYTVYPYIIDIGSLAIYDGRSIKLLGTPRVLV